MAPKSSSTADSEQAALMRRSPYVQAKLAHEDASYLIALAAARLEQGDVAGARQLGRCAGWCNAYADGRRRLADKRKRGAGK
jgi:hypothetical protein